MVFSVEDKALIKNFQLLKGYGSRKLLAEFPGKMDVWCEVTR